VIEIARKFNNTVIVAVNKVDVIGSLKIEQLEEELFNAGLNLETKGGSIPVVYISAKFGRNIDLL
jgi:translation initiation factor IF-2